MFDHTLTDEAAAIVEQDGTAQVSTLPAARGVVPSELVMDVAIVVTSVAVIASRVVSLSCRLRKRGIVIDARLIPVTIEEVRDLPGGTVLVIDASGGTTRHDVCKDGVDLAAILARLAQPEAS